MFRNSPSLVSIVIVACGSRGARKISRYCWNKAVLPGPRAKPIPTVQIRPVRGSTNRKTLALLRQSSQDSQKTCCFSQISFICWIVRWREEGVLLRRGSRQKDPASRCFPSRNRALETGHENQIRMVY